MSHAPDFIDNRVPEIGCAPVQERGTHSLAQLLRTASRKRIIHEWAMLCRDQRIALDGAPAEAVDAHARDLATKRLEQLAARKAGR
jgi:hypothetical protein